MKILILGGNRFVGKRAAQLLVENGHEVTLLNRGNFDDGLKGNVQRIRGDKSALATLIGDRFFDVVIDQICMNEEDAKNAVSTFSSHTHHYILTSTMAVYPIQYNLKESDFRPEYYRPQKALTPLEKYSEAKRSAENALVTSAPPFSWSIARFPIILGDDDPTRRLYEEIQKIKNNEGLFYENTEALFSLIHVDDAAKALCRLALHQHSGAYNFASKTPIKVSDFLKIISVKTGRQFHIDPQVPPSPFSIMKSWSMDVEKSMLLGYEYQEISDWLPKLIS
ncbi:MAG TPA: NAD-dependent epimerase/dehydratase family protein [Bacteriovoracaceae bacterium]|nr:NAD-dependent epimerase/dehydratase family protein [Bacteriovoracaceae bacterium]